MQKLVTYGFLTALCALLTSACADSEGERPGTAASGGSGGATGNTGGTGGGAPTGGTGGATGGTGGSTGAPAACSGCVELTVVTTAAGQQAQYIFRQGGTTTYNMANALVTFRVRLLTPASEIPGEQMFVTPFAQNGEMPDNYPGVFRPQTVLSAANDFDPANPNAWVDVTLDLANTAPYGQIVTPPAPGGGADAGADAGDAGAEEPSGPVLLDNNNGTFNKELVFQYGIQVGVLGTATAFGDVRVALDSVTYRTPGGDPIAELPDQTFTMGLEGFQLDGFMVPPGTQNPLFRP